jgi:signal transduction histidine kinase
MASRPCSSQRHSSASDIPCRPYARKAYGFRVLATFGALLVLGSVAILVWRPLLPPAAAPAVFGPVSNGVILAGAAPDQEPWILVLNGAVAVLFIVASVVFAYRAKHGADPHVDALALTTSLIAFAQVHTVFAPMLDPDYLSIGDVCTLVGYILFLGGLVVRLGDELSDHVSREERLRLSRELHDGLAQHLGLLHLRLTMATADNRDPDQRMRDLVTARRLTEVAILEARQAVMALRNETVRLDGFRQTVQNFVGEFALNHEIQASVSVQGSRESVGADVQAEVLRILHEALSNSIRHGGATVVTMEIDAGPGALEIRVSDNGRGFDPESTTSRGVGLLSIRERIARRGGLLQFRSSPGAGASLNAWLPVSKG